MDTVFSRKRNIEESIAGNWAKDPQVGSLQFKINISQLDVLRENARLFVRTIISTNVGGYPYRTNFERCQGSNYFLVERFHIFSTKIEK